MALSLSRKRTRSASELCTEGERSSTSSTMLEPALASMPSSGTDSASEPSAGGEQSNMSSTTSGKPTLISMPLEILQQISLFLELDDIGSLRLASTTLSNIGVEFMLRTLRFHFTLDGMARVLAIIENPFIAKHVHKVAVGTLGHYSRLEPSMWNKDVRKWMHASILKGFTQKYSRTSGSSKDGNPHKKVSSTQENRDKPNDGHSRHRALDNRMGGSCMIRDFFRGGLARLPNLHEIRLSENGFLYTWTRPTEMNVTEESATQGMPVGNRVVAERLVRDLDLCEKLTRIQCNVRLSRLDDVRTDLLRDIYMLRRREGQQLSLILPNDLLLETDQCAVQDRRGLWGRAGDACNKFLGHFASLEELELMFPCRHSGTDDPCRPYCRRLLDMPDLNTSKVHQLRLRKLTLGYLATTAERLTCVLKRSAATLQELSLTRIDILGDWTGGWVRFLPLLRYYVDRLEKVEFHGVFRELLGRRVIDMDWTMGAGDWDKFEEEDHRAIRAAACAEEPRSVGYHVADLMLTRSAHVVRRRVRRVTVMVQKMMTVEHEEVEVTAAEGMGGRQEA